MRTYFSDIFPSIQKFSQKLDDLNLLINQHWVVIDDIDKTKNVFFFRKNNELLISQNGKVEKAKWEYLGHNSLLIDRKDEIFLFRHGFFDENVLALKIDSKEEYVFLVNETKFDKELNSSLCVIDFLNKKYIEPSIKRSIQNQAGLSFESINSLNSSSSYISPNHTVNKISESSSILGTITEQYLIEFEDGLKGNVFHKKKNKKFYFKEKRIGGLTTFQHLYISFDLCVNSLHYYLKTGKILKDGFIETIS